MIDNVQVSRRDVGKGIMMEMTDSISCLVDGCLKRTVRLTGN